MNTKERSCDFGVEQAIRKGHCERKNSDHPCVGTLTVTPTGIVLSCPLCGTGNGDDIYGPSKNYISEQARTLAQEFATRLGVTWDCLSTEAQLGATTLAQDIINGHR